MLGDRIVMMHRGSILHDFGVEEKKKLSPADLRRFFDRAHK